MTNRFIINGVEVEVPDGASVSFRNGEMLVNGRTHEGVTVHKNEIRIIEGTIHHLDSDQSVVCKNVTGNVSAGSSVSCDNVGGNVSAGSSVSCDDIEGNASAGSSISCDDIGGNAVAHTIRRG